VCPPPLPDIAAALAWFDTEQANLLASQHTATRHAWHPTTWLLAWTLDTFLLRRGHRHDQLAVWRAALEAVTHLPDSTARIHAHRNLGLVYVELGRHEEATGHLHQALALAEHHHDPTERAQTHRTLGRAWELRGDDQRALEHAIQALDLYRSLDQPVKEADALNEVGWYAARCGDYDTARAHCRAALALHQHHQSPGGEAVTLDSLGYIDHYTGHHQQAVGHYQHALAMFRDLGNTYGSADVLNALGHPMPPSATTSMPARCGGKHWSCTNNRDAKSMPRECSSNSTTSTACEATVAIADTG
jgi:tetratricopeptide (TPR) repeat protein